MATDPAALDLEPTSPEIKRYNRQKITLTIVSSVLSLVWLGVCGFGLGPWLGEKYTEWVGSSDALRLLVSAVVLGVSLEALNLPFDFWSSYVLEHRYGLSNQTFRGWLWKRVKGYLVGAVLGLIFLYGLYGMLWLTGEWWWLWATVGWLGLTLVLGRILPVVILPIFYTVTPLDNPGLTDRLRRQAEGTGLAIEGVYQLHLSEETKKANAALAGLGRTRRVLLGDTLLEQFTPDEIEVVFAHEVGHHVYRHIVKMIFVGVLLSLIGFWLADRILGLTAREIGYHDLSDPAALPLLLFVLGVFGLVLAPLQNALSRAFEVQCDLFALDRTGNPATFRSAFVKLARLNKADPDPHPLIAWLFYDHPPIRERLALADRG